MYNPLNHLQLARSSDPAQPDDLGAAVDDRALHGSAASTELRRIKRNVLAIGGGTSSSDSVTARADEIILCQSRMRRPRLSSAELDPTHHRVLHAISKRQKHPRINLDVVALGTFNLCVRDMAWDPVRELVDIDLHARKVDVGADPEYSAHAIGTNKRCGLVDVSDCNTSSAGSEVTKLGVVAGLCGSAEGQREPDGVALARRCEGASKLGGEGNQVEVVELEQHLGSSQCGMSTEMRFLELGRRHSAHLADGGEPPDCPLPLLFGHWDDKRRHGEAKVLGEGRVVLVIVDTGVALGKEDNSSLVPAMGLTGERVDEVEVKFGQ